MKVFLPILIYAVSPLRVAPCQTLLPSSIETSPTRTAFGATQSDKTVLGYLEFEIGMHLREGCIVSS
jgi:hypothetical protein